MLDINLFRDEKTREIIKKSEENRFKDSSVVDKIYELDKERIVINFQHDKINGELNKIQKDIKEVMINAKKNKDSAENVNMALKRLENMKLEPKERQNNLSKKAVELKDEIDRLIKTVGNLIEEDVPICKNDGGNITVRKFESKREVKPAKGYADLMAGYTNSAAGANVVRHRGYYLQGKMALLGRALKNYAVDFLIENGYDLMQTPVMMTHETMALTSQLSDFDDQLYKVEGGLYLIATSEQPLTALFMNQKMTEFDLPKKYAGESLCFRKEAGAYGKDNAGIFRVHQFEKIEQFVLCKPEESTEYHDKMIKLSEKFYESLEISFQVVLISSGELNDAASKKYDLEALFPNAGKFRELVSASNCTDYQSRNLNVAYGFPKKGERPSYVHMLNSTLCAVQRTLCCIVENYQDGDKIIVPNVLRKYTNFDEFEI